MLRTHFCIYSVALRIVHRPFPTSSSNAPKAYVPSIYMNVAIFTAKIINNLSSRNVAHKIKLSQGLQLLADQENNREQTLHEYKIQGVKTTQTRRTTRQHRFILVFYENRRGEGIRRLCNFDQTQLKISGGNYNS